MTLPTDSSRLASSVQVAGFIKQYENMLFVTVKVNILIKGIPGCLFTRTSLPKSLNNLEPICNYVNVKCSRLVILRIISVTSTFTVSENICYKCESHKLESNNFSSTFVFNGLKYVFHTCTVNCLVV